MNRNEPTYNILELAAKWQSGTITEEEKAFYEEWYASFNDTELELNQDAVEYGKLNGKIYAVLEQRISTDRGVASGGTIDKDAATKSATVRLWPRIAAISKTWKIAAAVAAITLGVWLYGDVILSLSKDDTAVTLSPSKGNDIAPGKNTATLTLADGSTINLSEAKTGVIIDASKLTYDDGTEIKDPDISSRLNTKYSVLNTITTPRGGTYQITLPDGTKVWLNADSKISFPSQFIGKQRKVLLTTGEAYFEAAKDKIHPFIVESPGVNGAPGQQVEVLGTHFNISSYADEGSTKTTLLEGSVKINDATILKPSQQASLQGSTLQVQAIDPSEAIAWKNGDFIFTKKSLAHIMSSIARWYDVELNYSPGVDTKQTFSVLVSRSKNISQILLSLEKTGKVKFKIEGRKVTVSP